MAEQKMRSMLVRQWRLLQLVRSSNQGKSIESLMDGLKVNQATIDRDLSILEEARLPLARLKHSGGTRVVYLEKFSFPPMAPSLDRSAAVLSTEIWRR
jgi:predicted DNA-binding transcriptional regulator YafY